MTVVVTAPHPVHHRSPTAPSPLHNRSTTSPQPLLTAYPPPPSRFSSIRFPRGLATRNLAPLCPTSSPSRCPPPPPNSRRWTPSLFVDVLNTLLAVAQLGRKHTRGKVLAQGTLGDGQPRCPRRVHAPARPTRSQGRRCLSACLLSLPTYVHPARPQPAVGGILGRPGRQEGLLHA